MKRFAVLMAMFLSSGLYAGKGLIPLKKLTTAVSPVERAIVLFNGKREIIILSNDVQTTQPAPVWELMPFPSEVSMDTGELAWLRFADSLMRQLTVERCPERTLEDLVIDNNLLLDNKVYEPRDLYMWKSKVGYSGFMKWLMDTLEKYCVDEVPERVEKAIYYYLNHGYKYWGVDRVDIDMEIGTVKPIIYDFRTRKPYYPLRMSASSNGLKTVMLYFVTKKKLNVMPSEEFQEFGPFEVQARHLTQLYPDIVNFFEVMPEDTLYFMGLRFNGLNLNMPTGLPFTR